MRVRIDEAGSDDETRRIDNALCATIDLADFDNSAGIDSNIGAISRRTGAVDNSTVADEQVMGHWYRPPDFA